ncbi:hypothetical protein CR194_09220 [Salipaludibacillus keqinensis]|uniref:Uncharacterized protein n=1 Tax=Salipaludibacillus keqinensis TaxID=2045207 RepID=A0A323TFS6_9BACI|nr:hypothetical protein [Salipaludibacillus keqinensis]PYZ93360.1 hypothetical protein CR194_09220 [Salipaludibacillus keqinensis]
MPELVRNNEEIFIVIYCFLLLWINISYIKDYKDIKKGLGEVEAESDLEINPNAIALMFFSLLFNFFRRWLFYILAVLITANIFVVIVSVVLFVFGLYDCLFNYSIERVKKSRYGFNLAVGDTLFISIFVIYLFVGQV